MCVWCGSDQALTRVLCGETDLKRPRIDLFRHFGSDQALTRVLCGSYQTGLADVHVEISFGNAYYPCDFAFTYECGMGAGALGDKSKLRVYVCRGNVV